MTEISNGKISIDYVDIKELNVLDLRKRISVITDEPVILKGTLRFNIDPESRNDENKIKKIIKRVLLEDLLKKSPLGLNQTIDQESLSY